MSFIQSLKEEHRQIERELIELETIINSEVINYPNLIHVYKELHDFWNLHEQKEDKIFCILKHEKITIPVKKMLFEHGQMRKYKEKLLNAINSGNNERVKNALNNEWKKVVELLRDHINTEDEILYRITEEQFSKKELADAEKAI